LGHKGGGSQCRQCREAASTAVAGLSGGARALSDWFRPGARSCRAHPGPDPRPGTDEEAGGDHATGQLFMTLDLKDMIRTIPDYPKRGIMFRDITTLLGDARAFRRAIDELVQPWAGTKIDKVAGIEARGMTLRGAVALELAA